MRQPVLQQAASRPVSLLFQISVESSQLPWMLYESFTILTPDSLHKPCDKTRLHQSQAGICWHLFCICVDSNKSLEEECFYRPIGTRLKVEPKDSSSICPPPPPPPFFPSQSCAFL